MRAPIHTFLFMVSLTLISKMLGFIRELIMANFYGTSYIVDAYVMATAIPGIIFGGIFGAIATAYTPTFSNIREKYGDSESNKFTNQVLNLLVVLSLIAISIGVMLSDQIQQIFASGFDGETARLTSFYIKITFSYVLFTSTAGIIDAYLQYKGVFLKPIISGYFQNIAIIAVIFVSAIYSHRYLVLGLLIGAMLRLIYISCVAKREGFRYKMEWSLGEAIQDIMTMAIPVFIGAYILQINVFVDKTLASRLPEGSVAALNYGMILTGLVTGLTVSLLVTLIYPKITKVYTVGDFETFNRIIKKGANIIAIVTIPFTFGILAFSNQIVQIVYERGEFNPSATALTSGAFLFYGIGLVFFSFNDFMSKIFYSMRNTRAPILCSVVSVIINIILNVLLIESMAHRGLALATSIASFSNTILLYVWIKRRHKEIHIIESWGKIFKILLSAAIAVSLSFLVYNLLINTFWMPRVLYMFISVIIAVPIYLYLLRIVKVDEVSLITNLFR